MRGELIQLLFPTVRVGATVFARGKNGTPVRVHVRQGDWDGACGLYCAAMALTLLGKISTTTALSEKKYSIAGALWRDGRGSFFDGLTAEELGALLGRVDPSLHVKTASGKHASMLKTALASLAGGELPILAWDSRNGGFAHWVLAIGFETVQSDDGALSTAILCLDPSRPEPVLCAYNGRLELVDNPKSYGKSYIRYSTNLGDTIPVTLNELVVLGEQVPATK